MRIPKTPGRHSETILPGGIVMRLELADVVPMIWRRLLVHSDVTLDDLHHIIQAAIGWHDTHRYEFIVGERSFRLADEDDSLHDEKPGHPRRKKLRLVARETDIFRYLYDFGDHWEHHIVIERFDPDEPDLSRLGAGGMQCVPSRGLWRHTRLPGGPGCIAVPCFRIRSGIPELGRQGF